eukprot:6186233-Pleurochrysis_carterae.AAC.1
MKCFLVICVRLENEGGVVERLSARLEEVRGLGLLLPLGDGNVVRLFHAVLGREGADAVELGRVEARSFDVRDLNDFRGNLEHCSIP